jgi:hypothetical protein
MMGSAALAFAINCVAAQAQSHCTFLIDRSGSMLGFEAPGAPNQIYSALRTQLSTLCHDQFGFSVGMPKPIAAAPVGGDTQLDFAFGWWLQTSQPGDTLLMLTDNIADDHKGAASEAQNRFDEAIRSQFAGLSGAELNAVRLPFSGKVFSLDAKPAARYPGLRALALYFVAKSPTGDRDADLNDFRAKRHLIEDVLKAVLPDAQARHRFTVRPFAALDDKLDAAPLKTDLAVTAKGQTVSGASVEYDPRTRILRILNLPIGSPLTVPIQLVLKSGPDFGLQQTHFDAEFIVPQSDLNTSRRDFARIDQEVRDIHPGEIMPVKIYVTVLPFEWLDKPTLWERLKRLFRPAPPIEGRIEIHFSASRKNISLDDAVRADWHTNDRDGLGRADPNVQRKIYRLEELLQDIAASGNGDTRDTLRVTLAPIRVQVGLVGSQRDTLALLAVVSLLLAGLFASTVWLSRATDYDLSGSFGSRRFRLGLVGSLQTAAVEGIGANIRKVGPLVAIFWSGPKVSAIPAIMASWGGTARLRVGNRSLMLTLRRVPGSGGGAVTSRGSGKKGGGFKP